MLVSATDDDTSQTTTVLFPDLSFFESDVVDQPEEKIEALSLWALAKIGTFQSRLEAILRSRELRSGGRVYMNSISTSVILRLANEVFGFNGWSSEILECVSTYEDFDEANSEYSMKQNARVRITLLDGTSIAAEGIGESLNMPHKYMCLGNSKKMAITNGLRNAILSLQAMLLSQEAGRSLKVI